MRHATALLLAVTLATPVAAQTRIIAQNNGWSAFGGTTEGGVAICGLETRDPNTGRHFLLQHLADQDRPILRLSRTSWNLGTSTTRPVRIVIDNRRTLSATATGAGRELSWPLALDEFEPAFRRGAVMRVEFPSGQDSSWDLSLRGTNAVMGAFMGCLRMMVIQPGETPPAEVPASPVEAPLRPPAEAPTTDLPRRSLPPDKSAPTAKPRPNLKSNSQNTPL